MCLPSPSVSNKTGGLANHPCIAYSTGTRKTWLVSRGTNQRAVTGHLISCWRSRLTCGGISRPAYVSPSVARFAGPSGSSTRIAIRWVLAQSLQNTYMSYVAIGSVFPPTEAAATQGRDDLALDPRVLPLL